MGSDRGHERGAVIPFVALMMTVLIGFTSVAVDLGRQRMVRRDLQAIADVVSLDLSRRLDGRTADEISTDPEFLATVEAARERNLPPSGDVTLTWQLGLLGTDRSFTEVSGTAVPDAVRVVATDDIDWLFRPGGGSAARAAVASSSSTACFSIGSFALGLHSGNSMLLNELIGEALNLGVLGYDGLATSSITLGDLAFELGATTPQELADTTVTYDEFLLAVARILERDGDTANADFLESLALNVTSTTNVRVGDLVGLDQPSGEAAFGGFVNVLDLVAASAFLVNGTNALTVPSATLNLLGLTNVTSSLSIIQSPQIACGPPRPTTQARTSQVVLSVIGDLANVNLPIPLVGSVLVRLGPLDLGLDSAEAIGTLTDVLCGNPEGIDVNVVTSLLQAGMELPVRITGNVNLLGLLGLASVDVRVTLSAATNPPPTSSDVEFRIPPDAYFDLKETGTGTVGLSGLALNQTGLSVTATLLGLPITLNPTQLGQLLNPVIDDVVNPLITDLDALLLGPLTDLLGLNVAGADVAALPREAGTPCGAFFLAA